MAGKIIADTIEASGSQISLNVGNVTVITATSSGITGNITGNVSTTGTATFSAGSAAAPSLTTSGDTNTGIFFPAADTIAFSEGGAEAMRIDNSGNVGIGTSSPGAKLELGSGTLLLPNNVFIQQKDSSGNAKNVAGVNASNQYNIGGLDGSSTVDTVRILTGGTVRATVTSGGDFQFNSGYGSVATAYGCRAWVNFNGTGVVAIRGSGNVTSITDSGAGDYTVNFTNAMPDANYCTNVTGTHDSGSYVAWGTVANDQPPTTTNVNVDFLNNAGTLTDVSFAQVSIFR